MTKLISVKAIEVLSTSQMSNVKGGVAAQAIANAAANASANSAVVAAAIAAGIVLDDKRRDRPGGGITTL